MPAKPVKIGSLSFSSKGEANEFFKKMLNRHDLGDEVCAADADHLSSLIVGHPEAVEKIGVGIKSFSVRSADYGTRCFWLNRIDGTTVKFSFRACY